MKIRVFKYDNEEESYAYQRIIETSKEPEDTDWSRYAFLHDKVEFRMYCFKEGTNDTLYQFAYNGTTYEFGHNSTAEIKIVGIPDSANTNQFAMLHDGEDYRLYLGDDYKEDALHQFVWDGTTYQYEPESEMTIEEIYLSSTNPIAMLHDKDYYRFYSLDKERSLLKQAVYNSNRNTYQYTNEFPVIGIPQISSLASFSMAYGQSDYWLYIIDQEEQDGFPFKMDMNINSIFG